jgi:hypothetical protein
MLKWRGFLNASIAIIEMAEGFWLSRAKWLKWPKVFDGFEPRNTRNTRNRLIRETRTSSLQVSPAHFGSVRLTCGSLVAQL